MPPLEAAGALGKLADGRPSLIGGTKVGNTKNSSITCSGLVMSPRAFATKQRNQAFNKKA